MGNKLLFVLLLIAGSGWAQQQLLKGKIVASVQDLEGIHVINISDKNYTSTASGGYFTIKASVGDTLQFSAVHLIGQAIKIKSDDFGENLFFVKMIPKINRLSELIVKDYSHINAESLGLVKKGQKSYTPAERRLNAASNPYAVVGLNASAGLDPLLNWFSGRTAMLKKEVEVEKTERLQNYLKHLHEQEYYISHFKIPSDYLAGFIVYAAENPRLVAAVGAKNKIMINFLIGELAVEYCKRLADGK